MDDVTRLSRCASCGASLPIGATGDLCESCARAVDSAPTVLSPSARQPARGPVAPKLVVGQTFGSYRIERLLGRGGMGDVYEAEHLEHGRRVALKVLNGTLAGAEDRARFLSEGELAASITHPHTVYIFGSEEIDGAPVIAMELLSGGTLRDLVQARGPLPAAQAVDAILHVIAGLEAAGRTGVLHRDVKPANCFVDRQGVVKVGDFGLSISTFGHQQTTGMFLGTPQYAPPEQIRGEALDVRADIYAVGGTLFYLLTGQPPFDDRDLTTLITRVTTEPARSPREMSRNVPPVLAEIVTRCLSKDRDKRPPTYAALEDLLRPFASAAPVPASLARRVLAGAIDQMLLMAIVMPLSAYLVFSGGNIAVRWALTVGQIPFWLIYFTTLEGRYGASLGKRLLGLRVVNSDGQAPGAGRALVRAGTFQLPSAITTTPTLILGQATIEQFFARHPVLGMLFAVGFYVLMMMLFVTARRRNGFAALQDLASKTRVVRRIARTQRGVFAAPESSVPSGASATRIGPFDVLGSIGATDAGDLWLGFDPKLKRRVWIHALPPGAPPIDGRLRDLGRPARLRWLNGRRTNTEAWDAYEAFDGVPLVTLPHAQRWGVVRGWLLDFSREIDAGLKDQSLGPLTLDRVWVTRDGHAKLLDFRAPGVAAGAASASPASLASAQRWLADVADRGLAGSSRGAMAPLSARTLIDALRSGAFTTSAAIVAQVTTLLPLPDLVAPWRRVASAMLPALTPIVLMLFGALAAVSMQSVARSSPDIDAAAAALKHIRTLAASVDPAAADERRRIEQYVAGTYRNTLGNEQTWSNPMTASRLLPYRELADGILARHPAVTPEELETLAAALGPFLATQKKEMERQQQRAIIAPQIAVVAMGGMGLGFSAAFGIVFAGIFGGGLLFRVFGLAVVNRRGHRVSRPHAVVRALIAWAPGIAFVVLCFRSSIPFRDLAFAHAHLGSTIAIAAALALFLGGALVAALRPARGLQDVVARTYVVPR